MSKLEVESAVLGSVLTNTYFLKNTANQEMILVDPADRADVIIHKVEEMEGKPVAILLTHGHFDHILAVPEVKEHFGIPVYACRKEEALLRDPKMNLSLYNGKSTTLRPDVFLSDLEEVELAGFTVRVYHTPGHTRGSCCYYLPEEGVLLSGDTLFCGSVGRTDFPGGSTSDIVASLHRLLNTLPGDTRVYPGHDEPTTIAYEMRYNPFV